MRLSFQGGPWANRLLDSTVTTPPAVVAPAGEPLGVYRRTEQEADSAAVVYEWSPDGTDASSGSAFATRTVVRDVVAKSRGTLRRLGGCVGGTAGMRARFTVEVVGAVAALGLAILTLVSREWIEVVFRFRPDQGSGALEWSIVCALCALSVGLTFAARRQWRQLTAGA